MKNIFVLVIFLILINCKSIQSNYVVYNRDNVLSKFDSILNQNVPEYKIIVTDGFTHNADGLTVGYSVYDLSDYNNRSKKTPDDTINHLKFIDKHFYHFVPNIMSMSYSHIAYFEDGKIYFFNAINCDKRGDSPVKFVSFVHNKYKNNKTKENIINNYRDRYEKEYVIYTDNYDMKLNCTSMPD